MTYRLDILDRLQRRVLEIISTALPLMTSSLKDADLVGLTVLRREMVAAMEAYAAYIQDHVLDVAIASGDPERVQLAVEIKAGSIALDETYQIFIQRWAHRDGTLNWPEYRLSAIVMMKQMRNHMRVASRWDMAA